MLNTYWEEMDMSDKIKQYHDEILRTYNFPEFISNLKCPYCSEPLGYTSIREFGAKFNTRNMGDIVVEFCCDKCSRMNTLYYRKQITKFSDLNKFISGDAKPSVDPVMEEDMYKLKYNNLVEKVLENKGTLT